MNPKALLVAEQLAAKALRPLAAEAAEAATVATRRCAAELGLADRVTSGTRPAAGQDFWSFREPRSPAPQHDKRISDELQSLIDRSAKGDADVAEVHMGEGKRLSASGERCREMFTRGIGGCYAAAVDTLLPSGERHLVLTHYPITSEAMTNIRTLAKLVPDTASARMRTAIFAPDTREIFLDTHKQFMRNLGAILRQQGTEPIRVHDYPMLGNYGAQDFGSIRFKIPRHPDQPIQFRTWFSQGHID